MTKVRPKPVFAQKAAGSGRHGFYLLKYYYRTGNQGRRVRNWIYIMLPTT